MNRIGLLGLFQASSVSSQWRFRTPTRENQAIAKNAEPKYDSEAAGDSVHLVAETQSLALLPDPPAPDPDSAHQIQLCCT
jgi:hypothetical protein